MQSVMRYKFLILPTLLLGLLGTGCTSSEVVTSDNESYYSSEINRKAEGKTAYVKVEGGQQHALDNFQLRSDSSTGFTEDRSIVSIATSRIDEVTFRKPVRGGILWGISSAFAPVVIRTPFYLKNGSGGNMWDLEDDLPGTITMYISSSILGIVGSVVGSNNQKTTYNFDSDSSFEKQETTTEEGQVVARTDSADQVEEVNGDAGDEEKETVTKSVDTQIPETSVNRPDDIAVVIGNKAYQHSDIPNVDFAARDAQTMKQYLVRTLGFRAENIIYVENASGSAMDRIFGTSADPQGQLYDWVKPGESSVFVYYSGHGAPSPESGNAYFIPSDTNPNYLSQNGYLVNQLYENLAMLPAESVTVVLEACFSGVSESGAVVPDISPGVLSVENPVMAMENGLAFTAGAADQVSTWYNEQKHGLFTYYFLNGLRGEADANGDRAVTAKEMESYLSEQVPYRAQRVHSRNQTPQVVGQDLDRVLVRYASTMPAQK